MSNYVKYIATREGVEKMADTWKNKPVTFAQNRLIKQILHDFPDSTDMFEYEDYLKHGTSGSASEFINRTLEDNMGAVSGRNAYVKYIATRPGVEKIGSHGLFSSEGEIVDLKKIADEVERHEGNIWTHIISLRREDAVRLGYDNAIQWRELLREKAMMFAKNMKIDNLEDFRWFAAFHDESHHPHVHMVAYSKNPRQGYLQKKGIANIKSALAKDIFKMDLIDIYTEQTKHRNQLTANSKDLITEIVDQINRGEYKNPKVMQLLLTLSKELANISGRKQYGRLSADVKKTVDDIIDEIASDSRIAELYDLWYERRFEVLKTYRKKMPDKMPLSEQKEFRSIKNIVISEALNIAESVRDNQGFFTFEDEVQVSSDNEYDDSPDSEEPELPLPDIEIDTTENFTYSADWTKEYKKARFYLYGNDKTTPDFEMADSCMLAEAKKGNTFAIYDAGRMHMDGLGREKNSELSQKWFKRAYEGFISIEPTLKRAGYVQYRIGKMCANGFGTEQSYETAAEFNKKSVANKNQFAAYALGSLHYRGEGVEKSYEKAYELYEMAASHDKRPNVFAMYELGKMCRDGIGTEKNAASSEIWFSSAYKGFIEVEKSMPDDKLQYRIGQMSLSGTGTFVDFKTAQEYFEKSALLENANAMYGLGKLYSNEMFSGYNIEKAEEWLLKAAENGHEFSKYALGKLYLKIDNIKNAVHWLFQSLKDNNRFAQYTLAKLFLKGEKVEKDIAFALSLLNSAAEDDELSPIKGQATYTLGKLYQKGDDVPKDIEKAEEYLIISAECGNQYAQYALGKLYVELGKYHQAEELLYAAVAQENDSAQYLLGKMLFKGDIFTKNIDKAIELLSESAENGNQFSAFQLGKLYLKEEQYKDIDMALWYLKESATPSDQYPEPNHWALYTLGKLYLYGKDVPRDEKIALEYLNAAAELGNPFATALIQNKANYSRKMINNALVLGSMRLLHRIAEILKQKDMSDMNKSALIDKKLRRKIDEKKSALGIRVE